MRAIKDNKVYTVSESNMDEYLALGYDILDDKGKLIKRSPNLQFHMQSTKLW